MFRVANADFIADKLASELLPLQEFREVTKNAQEAIARKQAHSSEAMTGRIEFDIDWALLGETQQWLLACADSGDGMTRAELERYTTTLAVEGASGNQSLTGNQGMGLKISGPTRHKRGILIRTWKQGEGWMVQVGWDPERREYGLIEFDQGGNVVVPAEQSSFPDFVLASGSGTVVTFLGNLDGDNTFKPDGRNNNWLFKYLHQRFFQVHDAAELVVRVPSGAPEEWPTSLEAARDRMRGVGGKSFNLSRVRGTSSVWSEASSKLGQDFSGCVELAGDPQADVPPARMHWWVFPTEGSDVSSRTNGGGSVAVLYQNELHDWRLNNQSSPFFARSGILFGKNRIGLVLEPLGERVTSDFARAHVLIGGEAVFDSEAAVVWADEFRESLPDQIRDTMAEEQSKLRAEDPDRAKRIRTRLEDVMSLLRPKRFRRSPDGPDRADGARSDGPGSGDPNLMERPVGPGSRRKPGGRRGVGAALASLSDSGEGAREIYSQTALEPMWVHESAARGFPIVGDDGSGLTDRAAGLIGEDAVTAPKLALNRDFRGLRVLVESVNEWGNPEGDSDKSQLIADACEEWVEQKMVEVVIGLRQLENGSTWTASQYDHALTPVGLTAAFMADRYHTLREVKRQVGPIRAK